MAPRLNKRQQRELAELEELNAVRTQPNEVENEVENEEGSASEEDSAPASRTKGAAVGFSALAPSQDIEEEEASEDDQPSKSKAKKTKKKKKKKDPKAVDAFSAEPTLSPEGSGTPRIDKKGKSKKKDKMDEIDRALAELGMKNPGVHGSQSDAGPSRILASSPKHNSLLAVSLQHLDSEAEMKKFFGSRVINASKSQAKAPRGAKAALQSLKSNLTKPQPTWWSASQREGLSIRPLNRDEVQRKAMAAHVDSGEKWWTVEYSQNYRSFTKAFMSVVLSGDPNLFWNVINKLPWHADTLLQLSEIYRHREENSQAVDFLNRAIFTYERAFIGAFAFSSGTNRLDFDRVENRPFYMAISRTVSDLQRRGCVRTAFEFARLLLSLDPHTDPYGALLTLDLLALKSGMHDWLLEMWDFHDTVAKASGFDEKPDFNVTALPGWAYARALALREKGGSHSASDASTQALKDAIMAFPCVVPVLADKADISFSSELRGHPAFRVHVDTSSLPNPAGGTMHLLAHLYAQRSASLWKTAENAAWLKDVAMSVLPTVPTSSGSHHELSKRFDHLFAAPPYTNVHYSVYRHAATLTDSNLARRLMSFFPRAIFESSQSNLACDPFPPATSVSKYDEDFFHGTSDVFAAQPRTRRQREADERELARMIPDPATRRQLIEMFDAHPQLLARFPGGVAQFAQALGDMPEEVVENLMMANAFAGGEPGNMPGAMPDDDEAARPAVNAPGFFDIRNQVAANDHEADDIHDQGSDEDDGDGEEEPATAVQMVRNVLNRFWGFAGMGQGQEDENSDSDAQSEDDEPTGGDRADEVD